MTAVMLILRPSSLLSLIRAMPWRIKEEQLEPEINKQVADPFWFVVCREGETESQSKKHPKSKCIHHRSSLARCHIPSGWAVETDELKLHIHTAVHTDREPTGDMQRACRVW